MVIAEALAERKETIAASADLVRLLDRLTRRAAPLLQRRPAIPARKALLSTDGGVCPADGSALVFDPWADGRHACATCGTAATGVRHDGWWVRFQHLWLPERAAHLAAVGVFGGDPRAADASATLLAGYAERYGEYPNRDNVLGPSRLFFSTYLESIWLTGYLAAASMLRDAGALDAVVEEAVSGLADEAANLIGEFDEGFSNRQTWHNAALAAVAVWFEDEELLRRAVEGPSGIVAHLVRGFGDDGMWYEGENYHLFALRGELVALGWARAAGLDLMEEPRLADRLYAALRAPALTALPDATFPARKDSRFGVSLAQPMYLEVWEVGLAHLRRPDSDLWSWLDLLYRAPPTPAPHFDSYLHEAGEPPPAAPRDRADLSWWALLEMTPTRPEARERWAPGSVFLPGQGLAVLREGGRYASLECGVHGGGHGHPDRLNLSLFSAGRHWLPDFGTGSYVAGDLFWYRSTLAHNAPRLDSRSQPLADALCDGFDVAEDRAWARGRFGPLTRTVVATPEYVLDLLELNDDRERLLELPWHVADDFAVESRGRWVPDTVAGDEEFVREVERLERDDVGAALRVRVGTDGRRMHLRFDGHLLRAVAPGAPGEGERTFLLVRARGRSLRLLTVIETETGGAGVRDVALDGGVVEVTTEHGVERHRQSGDDWEIERASDVIRLLARRVAGNVAAPLIAEKPLRAEAVVPHLLDPPALDGTLAGFDGSAALALDHEDQYRRSEEPYPGPDAFAAAAYLGWSGATLFLAVDVLVDEPRFRAADAAPLRLDNDPDDVHSDGLQLYLRVPASAEPAELPPVYGYLVVPDLDSTLRVFGASGTAGAPGQVRGAWRRTSSGYCVTLAVDLPADAFAGGDEPRPGDRLDFDLLVNHLDAERERRSGQLVWSGGGGWIWLRGDRQDPSRFGTLELGR